MLQRFITLLPFSFCLLFALQYLLRRGKTETQRLMFWTALVCAGFCFIDAMYVTHSISEYPAFIYLDLLGRFITPMLSLSAFLTLYSFRHPKHECRRYYWFYLVAPVVGGICLLVIALCGFSSAVAFLDSLDMHHGVTPAFQEPRFLVVFYIYVIGYFFVLSVEMIITLCYAIYHLRRKKFGFRSLYNFLFRGGEATPMIVECWCVLALSLLCSIRMGIPRFYWLDHPTFSAFISILLAMIVYDCFYIGTIAHMYEGTLREMLHPLLALPAEHFSDGFKDEPNAGEQLFPNEEQLADELVELMENKQLYRNPNLTLEDLAVRLNTSLNIVAQLIDHHMGLSFRDYTNKLRVLHAERYMVLHPHDTQEKVAHLSGFSDASSFSKKFQKIEGLTPREWLQLRQKEQNQRTR